MINAESAGATSVIISPQKPGVYNVLLSDGTWWWSRWYGSRWQKLIGTPERIIGWK